MTGPLDGRVVVVAGASSGMGRAIAVQAATAGAAVVAVARRASLLDTLRTQIEAAGGVGITIQADATDPAAVAHAVEASIGRFGRVDALVNAVGTNIPDRSLSVLSHERWKEVLSSNLNAAYVLTQGVLPQFRRQQDGLIVHIASAAVKKPDLSGVAYQAAKAGVAGLARATMEEERGNGIRVSIIFPGLTDTPLVEKRPTPVAAETLALALQPEDVASICLALLSLPTRAYVPEVSVFPARL